MKRRQLLKHLRKKVAVNFSERVVSTHGGTIPFPTEGQRYPRHTEIMNILARKICRDLGVEATELTPNQSLQPTANPLRGLSAAEPGRHAVT